ncbi:enoyl-CoA hydratase [Pseudomonas sp. SJZ103]|nr:enoyl-CoA hydratase [Pseudomonas sp. SJZ103]TWC78717.1 enoyl-CoA hydratase [Pseudomonas sp. SJZ094]
MTTDVLIQSRSKGVLALTLNRPAARNALNLELARALTLALTAFENDPELRVATLTGSNPAFCAGLDLKDFSTPDAPRHEVAALLDLVPNLSKPIIAAVNGAAMTGGLELALGCDFIIASTLARFADTHTKIGALSGSGATSRLPFAVGVRWGKQLSLTGQPIDAETALRIGLVNELHAPETLLAYVQDLAECIASHDVQLVGTVKRVLDDGARSSLANAQQLEKKALAASKLKGGTTWKTP